MAGWISVYIAASLDGFIADRGDGLDWLTGIPAPEGEDYGYADFIQRVDALVMGRRTFEKVAGFDPWPYEKPVFVLSRTLKKTPLHLQGRVELLMGEPQEVVRRLSDKGYERLYIDGGKNITAFLRAGLVDEIILTTVPVLLGGGVPLFSALEKPVWFELVASRSFSNGLTQVKYHRRQMDG